MAASIEIEVESRASASGPCKNKGGKKGESTSTSMVRKPSFPSTETFVEEIGLFSIDLDDGSTWSPNSVVDSRKTVDLFQLESDILTLSTICSASTVKEDVTLRRVGRSLKRNSAACGTAKEALAHLKSQGFAVELAYSRHKKGINRDGDIFTPRHEFLKVEVEGSTIVVDTDFRSSFAIARPSYYYSKVFEELPSTYVGSEERLRLLVAFMSEQLRRNFSHSEMACPPWRQNKALLNTWAL
jgi:uncharacterized protein (TIGR01615 family)